MRLVQEYNTVTLGLKLGLFYQESSAWTIGPSVSVPLWGQNSKTCYDVTFNKILSVYLSFCPSLQTSRSFYCPVCFQRSTKSNTTTASCGHSFCDDCWVLFCVNQLKIGLSSGLYFVDSNCSFDINNCIVGVGSCFCRCCPEKQRNTYTLPQKPSEIMKNMNMICTADGDFQYISLLLLTWQPYKNRQIWLTCLHPCCRPIQIVWWFTWEVI